MSAGDLPAALHTRCLKEKNPHCRPGAPPRSVLSSLSSSSSSMSSTLAWKYWRIKIFENIEGPNEAGSPDRHFPSHLQPRYLGEHSRLSNISLFWKYQIFLSNYITPASRWSTRLRCRKWKSRQFRWDRCIRNSHLANWLSDTCSFQRAFVNF